MKNCFLFHKWNTIKSGQNYQYKECIKCGKRKFKDSRPSNIGRMIFLNESADEDWLNNKTSFPKDFLIEMSEVTGLKEIKKNGMNIE